MLFCLIHLPATLHDVRYQLSIAQIRNTRFSIYPVSWYTLEQITAASQYAERRRRLR